MSWIPDEGSQTNNSAGPSLGVPRGFIEERGVSSLQPPLDLLRSKLVQVLVFAPASLIALLDLRQDFLGLLFDLSGGQLCHGCALDLYHREYELRFTSTR